MTSYPEVQLLRVPALVAALRPRARGKGRLWKAVCSDKARLEAWAREHGINGAWIHESRRGVYHIDLWGGAATKLGLEAS